MISWIFSGTPDERLLRGLFELRTMVTEAGHTIVAQGRYTVSIGGGQPGTSAPSVVGSFRVNGQVMLRQ